MSMVKWRLVSKEVPAINKSTHCSTEVWLAWRGEKYGSFYYDKGVYFEEGSIKGFKTSCGVDGNAFLSMPIAWTELPTISNEVIEEIRKG